MKIILCISIIIISIIIISCNNIENTSFSSDVDKNYGWTVGTNTIIEGPAHSGSFCSKIDSINPYSFGFYYSCDQISLSRMNLVNYQAWVKLEKIPSDIKLVFAISSSNKDTNYIWTAIKVNDFVVKENEWTLIQGYAELPKGLPNNAEIWYYAWSPIGEIGYIDDLEINFK